MKKMIIDIGLDKTTVAKVNYSNKNYRILEVGEIENGVSLNNNGTINIKKITSVIKEKYKKEIKSYDVELILPSTMSAYLYKESGKKDKFQDTYDTQTGKLIDKIEIGIGDNGSYKMNEAIYYNKNAINTIVKEFYSQKINVTSIITNISAYQRTMPFFSDTEDAEYDQGAHLYIDVGLSDINCIIFEGNIPIYMKKSGYDLMSIYTAVKSRYEKLTLDQFLSVYTTMMPNTHVESSSPVIDDVIRISQTSEAKEAARKQEQEVLMATAFDDEMYQDETEDNQTDQTQSAETTNHTESGVIANLDNYTLDYEVKNEIKKEIHILMTEVINPEIRDVVNYARESYHIQNLLITSNSMTALNYINYSLSEVYNVFRNRELKDVYHVGNLKIDLSNLSNKPMTLLGCLGSIVCETSKGGKIYA